MQFSRWTNPSLPQTLQYGMFLLYLDAVFGVLGLSNVGPIGLLLVVVGAFAGLGIANEYKWGWKLGVAVSGLALVPIVLMLANGNDLLFIAFYALFPVAQFALLVHPQSRNYQKVWFH